MLLHIWQEDKSGSIESIKKNERQNGDLNVRWGRFKGKQGNSTPFE